MALAPTLDLSLATSRIKNLLGREGYTPSVFFCLDSCMGKILTGDYLRRRGFTIVDWCCLCQCSGENFDHLLLHCGEVSQLWSFAFR